MARREQRLQLRIFDEAIGLVVALPLLVLDDVDLVGEVRLRHRAEQMPHPVALQPQRARQRRGGHRLEIVGAIEPGGAVIVRRADLLERFEEVAGRIFRAVEHQMFEQVREARLARRLVLRSDMVPDRYRDHGSLVILVHEDAQPVGQREIGVRDVHRLHERGDRRGPIRRGPVRRGLGQRRHGKQERRAEQGGHETRHGGFPSNGGMR